MGSGEGGVPGLGESSVRPVQKRPALTCSPSGQVADRCDKGLPGFGRQADPGWGDLQLCH